MDVQAMKDAFSGPIASVSTPFTRQGEVDWDGLANVVEFCIAAGSPVLLLTYGDSLYSLLTDEEIAQVTRFVTQRAARRVAVVAGGKWALNKSEEFAKSCVEWGADVFMPLPPEWALSSSDETLTAYYRGIARHIPIVLMTSLHGRPLPLPLVEALLADGGVDIVGVKDDVVGAYGRQLVAMVGGRRAFLSGGRKVNHFDQHFYGPVDGYLSVYLRFMPGVAHLYQKAMSRRRYDDAAAIMREFDVDYFETLVAGTGLQFDAVIHAAMEVTGQCGRWRRNPFTSATDAQVEQVRDYIAGKARRLVELGG